jgi:hypothetical protein
MRPCFQDDARTQWLYFLAEEKHMTVARLTRELPERELQRWKIHYKNKAEAAEKRRKQREAKAAVRKRRR